MLQPPKYHICSLRKALLKIPRWKMHDFIYKVWYIYIYIYTHTIDEKIMGMGEKSLKEDEIGLK